MGIIVGAGFHKTGTSTLREALKILGYKVKDTTPGALIPILRGNYSRILRILKGYDAVEDTPWFMIYKELDSLIPGTKFILTERNEDDWYRSVSRHIGELRAAHHEWIYGRGKGLPKDDKANTVDVYRRHNAAVKAYFSERTEDLLVIDFTRGEEWEALCKFLNKPIPDQPFPHYNKSKSVRMQPGSFRFIRKSLKNRFKIKLIALMQLWPAE